MEPSEPTSLPEPPADPEEWTDEQWIEWLVATDPDGALDEPAPPPSGIERVTRRSGGQILGAAMLGMANAIYGKDHDEVAIVVDGDTDPDDEKDFSVHLDRDHPERSTVVFHQRAGSDPAPADRPEDPGPPRR